MTGYEQSPDYGSPQSPPGFWTAMVIVTLGVAVLMWLSQPSTLSAETQSSGEVISSDRIAPVDTDTFKIDDQRHRIKGWDGPGRKGEAKCDLEIQLAEEFNAAVAADMKGQDITITANYGLDFFDRPLVDAEIHGEDWGERYGRMGYLKRWNYGKEPKPDWCNLGD